jgi:hypothetical protein
VFSCGQIHFLPQQTQTSADKRCTLQAKESGRWCLWKVQKQKNLEFLRGAGMTQLSHAETLASHPLTFPIAAPGQLVRRSDVYCDADSGLISLSSAPGFKGMLYRFSLR